MSKYFVSLGCEVLRTNVLSCSQCQEPLTTVLMRLPFLYSNSCRLCPPPPLIYFPFHEFQKRYAMSGMILLAAVSAVPFFPVTLCKCKCPERLYDNAYGEKIHHFFENQEPRYKTSSAMASVPRSRCTGECFFSYTPQVLGRAASRSELTAGSQTLPDAPRGPMEVPFRCRPHYTTNMSRERPAATARPPARAGCAPAAAADSVCRLAAARVDVAPAVGSASTNEYEVCVTTEMPPSAMVDVRVWSTFCDDTEVLVDTASDDDEEEEDDTVEVATVVSSVVVTTVSLG